ncbi:hypothetical protein GIB67_014090 [Kingdonia uniflora]|uniref:Uncharacterized protein n=1 Tax=Kingdonia uniflora TaxID=39325 RepID=A0A7J7KXD9_9MAGN|nr:hypothetical protein GIB67_014090 [Kingdonia uniflora]
MVTTRRQAYEARVQTKMASLQTRYFGTQSLSLPTPIPVPPTFHGISWEEVGDAEDDYHQMWRFHYMVLFVAHRRFCLRMLAEDAVVTEDEKVGVSSVKYCRYAAKDWMRSKNLKPSSKFVVSSSSEESSSSDRTMDDSEVIGTVTVDKLVISSRRDVGLHAMIETGQFFRTLVRPGGNIKHYQVPSLNQWKRSMYIGDNIDIAYYNGTDAEVVEEGFLCYLNQVVYGLSIPLTFFQKRVINALKSCPGQLNSNVFEMMRVCEALNQRWRDGGIAIQFVADDVLKYYKFKYVKDQKSGYLFSDSARPKFFDFEYAGRPWCDHLVMVRGNCMLVPGEPALELIYKNFNKKPNAKFIADMPSMFDVVSREGNKLSKVLGKLGIRREKRLNSIVEKVQRAHQNRAMATFDFAYDNIMEIPACVAALAQTTQAETEVDAAVNMAPPHKKQKQESGKDIRASSKGVNLKAVEQEALDLAKRDPIRLDTQIRSSISLLSVAWKSAVEVLKVAAADRVEYEAEKVFLVEQLKDRTVLCEQLQKEKALWSEQLEREKAEQKEQFKAEVVDMKKEVEADAMKTFDKLLLDRNNLVGEFYYWGLTKDDLVLVFAKKYNEIIFPDENASPVADHPSEQTPAPEADDTTKEVVRLRGKVIEMEKALSRAMDSITRTQQDKRFVDESDKLECQRSLLSLTLYFEAEVDSERGLKKAYLELLTKRGIVPDPARVKFLAQEARNCHSTEAQRCSARAIVFIIWGGVGPLPDELDFVGAKSNEDPFLQHKEGR